MPMKITRTMTRAIMNYKMSMVRSFWEASFLMKLRGSGLLPLPNGAAQRSQRLVSKNPQLKLFFRCIAGTYPCQHFQLSTVSVLLDCFRASVDHGTWYIFRKLWPTAFRVRLPKYIFTKCEFNELTLHLQVTKVQWSGSSFTFRILVFVTVAPVSQIPR